MLERGGSDKMALKIQPPHPSVSERRGQRLAPLQTDFGQTNFSRPTARPAPANRPRPNEYANANGEAMEKVPLQPPKRQSSKASLRSLFGRDKSARKPAHDHKLAEIDEAHPTGTNANINASITKLNLNNNNHTTQPDMPLSPNFCNTPKTAVSTPTLVTSPTSAAELPSRDKLPPSKPPPPKPSEEDKPPARDLGWKPPPLFQAYPQAIKHSTLPAPTLSADAILRAHATFSGGGSREDETIGALSQQKEDTREEVAARKKKEDKERKHLRSLSETIGKTDWVQKVYVVTTSGYILQYSGEGKYDRLPEKMLLLGPKSVAFASDAIPGKHWVLQVSQGPDGSEAPASTDVPRPLLTRLGFHRSYTRRLTQSFLLVFNDPDELSSWLLTVRAQIEARGGKKYVSERVFDDGMEQQLRSKTSVRQLVKRDPNRFSNLYLQPQTESQSEGDSRRSSYVSNSNRHSLVSTAATDLGAPQAAANGGSRRFYAVTTATATTSESTPTVSPIPPRDATSSSATRNHSPANVASPPPREAMQSPPVLTSPKKRRSMAYMSTQPVEPFQADVSQLPRSQSTAPDPSVRSVSPPAPNFSVPSFSKRFAARTAMSNIPPLQLKSIQQPDHQNEDDFDVNAIASFPSPPQSPVRSLSSMSRNDTSDPHGYVSRQSSMNGRRPLRVSPSQDSLVTCESMAQQSNERKPSTAITRPPGSSVSTVNSTPRPSRPMSIVSSVDASLTNGDIQSPQSPAQSTRSRRDPHKSRTSVLHPTNNTTNVTYSYSPMPNVSRRKSMPGLAVGPPTLPPPNCPLPKIPSPMPVDPSAADTALPASPRSCKSPPPHGHGLRKIKERKSSAGVMGHSHSSRFSLGMRSISSSAR